MPFTRHLISQPSVLHCPFSFWHSSPKILAPPSSILPTPLMMTPLPVGVVLMFECCEGGSGVILVDLRQASSMTFEHR
ncbi:hypothetical protein GYMLUDRAFT_916598 [Collybiopsis luxurians FD-317 M1]|uniref:Uncharacterized protein n=1 Tax=Collybiopsis luxurians FD-317 M1 TaxID=944289 RepID=A0A0D0BWY4_9AGAR|nr:hypothetical protein GYMLUDRAFT_916598 [Collybiopsis luxurians FD-317 M1]